MKSEVRGGHPPHVQEPRLKVSTRLTGEVWDAVSQAMQKHGYNKKQKSIWVSESVLELFQMWNAYSIRELEYLDQLEPDVAHVDPTKITLTPEAAALFSRMVDEVDRKYTKLDNVKTRLLFAAIYRRLTKEGIDVEIK